ncbi:MAG: tetratricopeptide repeat protein, partial [Ardenticatenaceae bacterium]
AITMNPTYVAAHSFLAEAYVDSQRYDEALATAQQAVEIDPDDVWAWRNLGYVNESLSYYDQALAAYREGIQVKPLSHLYIRIGRIQLYHEQNFDVAIETFRQATIVDPRNPEIYAELANIYIGKEDPATAIDYLEQGIEKDPTFGRNYGLLGQLYYTQLNFETAIEALEKAVSFGYSNETVYFYLGLSYAYLEQCEEAVPWLERALALNPESGPALAGMQLCGGTDAAGDPQNNSGENPPVEAGSGE